MRDWGDRGSDHEHRIRAHRGEPLWRGESYWGTRPPRYDLVDGAPPETLWPDYTGRGPRNYRRSDGRILEDVCERLTEDPRVDAYNIDVKVKNGEVTLAGDVTSRDEKRRAEDVAATVMGVADVVNELRVVGM